MNFQAEPFADVWREAQGLVQALAAAHWSETEASMYGARSYSIDAEQYHRAADAGLLYVFTARTGGVLVGYATFFVSWNTHLDGMSALLDALYVDQKHRGHTGMGLLRYAQTALSEAGARAVQYVSPASRDCGSVYRRLGAVVTETVYTRMC